MLRILSLKELVVVLDLPISFEAFLKINHGSIERYGSLQLDPQRYSGKQVSFLGEMKLGGLN